DEGVHTVRNNYRVQAPWLTYGLSETAARRAVDGHPGPGGGYMAAVRWQGAEMAQRSDRWGQLALQIPGLHNLRNGLAALTVAHVCDLPAEAAIQALGSYGGVARRFEWKGETAGVAVIDDYAHHPTEVQ